MAVDGTKVRGQNSLKNNFNAKKIRRHLEYIDGRIGDYLDQLAKCERLLRTVQVMGLEKLQKQLGKLIFELWRLLWPTWSRYEPRFIVFP
ncbi:MAG: hypothetical protein GYB31_16635 [Bacteroidetes bacterium]|nr:hypothetical protein [Bacteroidota bacterium]